MTLEELKLDIKWWETRPLGYTQRYHNASAEMFSVPTKPSFKSF